MDVMDQIVGATLDTTATGGGNQLNYGNYVVFLDKVIVKQGNEGPLFIPEFYVDTAEDVAVDGVTQKATTPGSIVGYSCKMNQKEAASNARGFVLAVLGLPETGKDDPNLKNQINQAMRRMVMADQPLRGMAFRVTTWKYVNKGRRTAANAGKSFPRYKFEKLPGQNMATLTANRLKMDNVAQGRANAQAQAVLNPAAPAPMQAPPTTAAPQAMQYAIPAHAPPAPAAPQPVPQAYVQPASQYAQAPTLGAATLASVPVHQYPQAPPAAPAVPQPAPAQYAPPPAPLAAQPDPFAGMFGT